MELRSNKSYTRSGKEYGYLHLIYEVKYKKLSHSDPSINTPVEFEVCIKKKRKRRIAMKTVLSHQLDPPPVIYNWLGLDPECYRCVSV